MKKLMDTTNENVQKTTAFQIQIDVQELIQNYAGPFPFDAAPYCTYEGNPITESTVFEFNKSSNQIMFDFVPENEEDLAETYVTGIQDTNPNKSKIVKTQNRKGNGFTINRSSNNVTETFTLYFVLAYGDDGQIKIVPCKIDPKLRADQS